MLLTISIALEVANRSAGGPEGPALPLWARLHLRGLCPLRPRPVARLACRGRHPLRALPFGERERALCCVEPLQGKALVVDAACAVISLLLLTAIAGSHSLAHCATA